MDSNRDDLQPVIAIILLSGSFKLLALKKYIINLMKFLSNNLEQLILTLMFILVLSSIVFDGCSKSPEKNTENKLLLQDTVDTK